jgi:hypothetical protein
MEFNDANKKRSHCDESETKDEPILAEPEAKRPKLIDLTNTEPEDPQDSDDKSVSSMSSEDDEEGPPKHTASWWRDFHSVPAEYHTSAIMLREKTFLDLVLPPVDPKWKNKVMYAMSYVGSRANSIWKHYGCVTKEDFATIKAFIAANPEFEFSLGELEGKHSDVRVTWKDVVDWESSDPRDLQEYDPLFNDGYAEIILINASQMETNEKKMTKIN